MLLLTLWGITTATAADAHWGREPSYGGRREHAGQAGEDNRSETRHDSARRAEPGGQRWEHVHEETTSGTRQGYTRRPAPDPGERRRESHERPESSDDSDNSEDEDRRLAEEAVRVRPAPRRASARRREWRPATSRHEYDTENERTSEIDVRRTERYIGDQDDGEQQQQGEDLRVATTNINKGIWGKIDREVRTWFIANRLDFLLIADAGAGANSTKTIWSRGTDGTPAPGMLVVTSKRAAIMVDQARWGSRWKKADTQSSPSGRSISITLRLGQRAELVVMAVYLPDTPHENQMATRQEREWIAQRTARARARGDMVIVAGDFNSYTSEEYDRSGPSERQLAVRRESQLFAEWLVEMEMTSSFRHRHVHTARYTYERAGTRSALDDILISDRHARQVAKSGIWLGSVQASDHIGTPFMTIALERTQRSRRQLVGVKAIKRIMTKTRTSAELTEFAAELNRRIETGQLQLHPPLPGPPEEQSVTTVQQWLEGAIANLYECMYNTAKHMCGETSQSRRDIDRTVSIKRTTRCHGQWKALRRLTEDPQVSGRCIVTALRRIQWPKWVLFPDRTPAGSPHASGARQLHEWVTYEPPCPDSRENTLQWYEEGWQLWKRVLRTRRDWRARERVRARELKRDDWMKTGKIRSLLQATLGKPLPPVTIQGALVGDGVERKYVETRAAVQTSMCELLDTWVPAAQRTTAPHHLTTASPDDVAALPEFVREWLLPDIIAGGSRRDAFAEPGHTWAEFQYDTAMQSRVDKKVSKGVSPGFGGVAQELWIAAPSPIRAQERAIFTAIIRTGVAPAILNHRQMIFLPKSASASGVWERQGLPPWRPITVQSALTTRLFTAISWYLEDRAPNHPMQHGFQRDRNVQDAALATTLLMDRATRRKEEIYLLSKDCEKCYDRIPKWVMDYIYRSLGVPDVLRAVLMTFLSAGEIDIRTAYGWVPTGTREFGLGQGSVLSIRHIGFYMDTLLERQTSGPDGVVVKHSQGQGGCVINSTVLVDDVIDVASTRAGIEHRVAVSNVFTGIAGTGGVFGASKSFLLHYDASGAPPQHTVYLSDGMGVPQAVRLVSPAEGFKHLGIVQSTADVWSSTLKPVWEQIKQDARAITTAALAPQQLRYIVNHVWMPRILYRTQLGTTIKAARHIDHLIRRVARQVLRLPHSMPTAWFTDATQGLGLQSCVDACNVARVQIVLRTLNTPHIPAFHLLTEALEDYQVAAGLTQHPLANPIAPPSHLQQWVHQTIRAAAALRIATASQWTSPVSTQSTRPNDKSLWEHLTPTATQALLRFNLRFTTKLRHVGDIVNVAGTAVLSAYELQRRYQWTRPQAEAYAAMAPELQRTYCTPDTHTLSVPVGRTVYDASHLRTVPIAVGAEQFFVVSEFELTDAGLAHRGYEIGQRIGDATHECADGMGTEIEARWWHERRAHSDVWTERTGPDRISNEYADVCVPVVATPVQTRGQLQVIFWNDTVIRGQRGAQDRTAIMESFRRSVRRHDAITTTGRVQDEARQCWKCGRQRGAAQCRLCSRWHHVECVVCPAVEVPPFGAQWASTHTSAVATTTTCAGDGSVQHGGTTAARGGWGLRSTSGHQQGRLDVHWRDMTSTRMECHALLMGLYVAGDQGLQVCDNQAAIRIMVIAREIATGTRPRHIAYTNKHRVEIRSMVKHMRQGGTFVPHWVRSHQEHAQTNNAELRAQRAALETADELATHSYVTDMNATYTEQLDWDTITLLDEEGRPVMGSTRPVLAAMAATSRKAQWMDRQHERGEHRETACATTITTTAILHWSTQQCRYYWRTISHALHTNAQKHRLHDEWDARCRCCTTGAVDTQEHRFGLGVESCASAEQLHRRRRRALERARNERWMPDQEYYIPGRAAALARYQRSHAKRHGPHPSRTAQRTVRLSRYRRCCGAMRSSYKIW